MYELYCENRNKCVSLFVYQPEFHKLGLKFKKPNVDTCHNCDVVKLKIEVADTEIKKKRLTEMAHQHQTLADKAYVAKRNDEDLALQNNDMLCYTFDMQQCLPTPLLQSSVAFYKRPLWTYNLTIHETSKGTVKCYMWSEVDGARGGNQIATCLFKELMSLPNEIKHVVLYSDNCPGQNKNSHVAATFLSVMAIKKAIKIIDHKFLISGHTHMECDIDHGLIEKQKKNNDLKLSHPHDWFQLVRNTGANKKFEVVEIQNKDFKNFAALLSNALVVRKQNMVGEPFLWSGISWMRYTDQPGTIQYKTDLDLNSPFKVISLLRRSTPYILEPPQLYRNLLPISNEKKKDLLDMLPLIHPVFHQFYKDLPTNNEPDIDPDLTDE